MKTYPFSTAKHAHDIEFYYSYKEDATGICDCGKRIRLYNEHLGACECPRCGRWWNLFGDELKNPHHWNDYGELDYDY